MDRKPAFRSHTWSPERPLPLGFLRPDTDALAKMVREFLAELFRELFSYYLPLVRYEVSQWNVKKSATQEPEW